MNAHIPPHLRDVPRPWVQRDPHSPDAVYLVTPKAKHLNASDFEQPRDSFWTKAMALFVMLAGIAAAALLGGL